MPDMITALDPVFPDVRVDFGMARAEYAQRSARIAAGEQYAAVWGVVQEARLFPETFVGHAFAAAPDAGEFAVRAAVADLAVRLSLAESTIRQQGFDADLLIRRAPTLWAAFRAGEVPVPNATVAADLLTTLDESLWSQFDAAMTGLATSLPPARFRARARVARDRLEPQALAERHRQRAEGRRVWIESDVDGMAWLTAYLPADRARLAIAHLDHAATSLATAPDETRTLPQLRADVAGDLLAGVLGAATPHGTSSPAVGVTVAVTVPVLTLLGGDQPGTLEGHGPIDADTARKLAAHAPSFLRILTDPIDGTVLDVGRRHYRPPADLARFVRLRDQVCTFPGCARDANGCDLDHTIAWEHGGTTNADNLTALCRNHHRLKHNTRWEVKNRDGTVTWTSPTGHTTINDPPPF